MKKKFYNLRATQETHVRCMLLIGDFNSKIGQPKEFENLILSKYGFGKRNERGEMLLQYACDTNWQL